MGVFGGDVVGGFVARMAAGFSYKEHRQSESEAGVGDAEEERLGAQSGVFGDVAGRERGDRDGPVACGFVHPHGEAASGGADEVDLHDHGRRPGESLVDAEQDVGEDHPSPARCPDQQQRDRYGDDPPGDQHRFAAIAIGQRAGKEVGGRFDGAEGDDERERRRESSQPEFLLGEQREHGAFLADHATDERVDTDEKGELGDVLLEPEPQGCLCGRRAHGVADRGLPVAVDQVSGPPSRTTTPPCPRAVRMLAALIARSP